MSMVGWRREAPVSASYMVVRPQTGCCCGCMALVPMLVLLTMLIVTVAILR